MTENEQSEIATTLISEESAGRDEEILSVTSSDKQTTINILLHFCKGCEICVEVCPKGVLEMIDVNDRWEGTLVDIVNIETCNACMLCEVQCPDFAIEVYNVKKEKKKKEKKAIA